jgi:glucosamine 6-phosphate synthetase-like amidotransferase/phosphosugar isomerase protein
MCGIGAIINYGEDKINLDMVETMFKNLEGRGNDASGIYYERPGKDGSIISRVFKAPVPATDLWNSVQGYKSKIKIPKTFQEKWRLDGTERLILMHTRWATQGPVSNNHNNMPIYSDKHVLVHNGSVWDNKKIESFKYKGQVDSETILARLDTDKDIETAIRSISGSMAIIVRPLKSKHIHLYRNTNPLVIITPTDTPLLFVCSVSDYVLDKEALEAMGKNNPFVKGETIINVKSGTLYTIGIHEKNAEEIELQDDDEEYPDVDMCDAEGNRWYLGNRSHVID